MDIYLDNNATTPIIQPVLKKQVLALKFSYGNPSSLYRPGILVKRELDDARKNIANLINADLDNSRILFTSCATEANNSVFNSVIKQNPGKKHIIISSVEHSSVFSVAERLQSLGYRITYIPVNTNGEIDMEFLKKKISEDTLLVSIMTANNETGVIYPIKEIVALTHSISPNIFTHTDAVQAVGKIPVDVQESGVDFLSLSGHKFHAPKGVGALYIKGGVNFSPFLLGGHQEGNLRAGTENVASIIAMGEASVLAKDALGKSDFVRDMRDKLENELSSLPIKSYILGKQANRLPNTSNIAFSNIDGMQLMLQLSQNGIYVSTGSACNSTVLKPSRIITAMKTPIEYQKSIRISLSSYTKQEDINKFLEIITKILLKKGK